MGATPAQPDSSPVREIIQAAAAKGWATGQAWLCYDCREPWRDTLRTFWVIAVFAAFGTWAVDAEAAKIQSLPPTMLGSWGWNHDSCRKPDDDGRLTVKARTVEFTAGGDVLVSIDEERDATIRARTNHRDEGETEWSQQTIELKLTPSGLYVLTGSGLEHTYVRCASAN